MATQMLARDIAKRRVHSLVSILIPMAIFLTGCTNQLKQADVQKKEDMAAAAEADRVTASIDDAKCQSFGHQPGSPGYAQCRKDLNNDHKQFGVKE